MSKSRKRAALVGHVAVTAWSASMQSGRGQLTAATARAPDAPSWLRSAQGWVSPLRRKMSGYAAGRGEAAATVTGLPKGRPFRVDLSYVKIDDFYKLGEEYLPENRQGRPLLAFWSWGLSALPDVLRDVVARFAPDGVLVNSTFCADVLSRHLDCPVQIVAPIANMADQTAEGAVLRLDVLETSATRYLTSFDATSDVESKNPFGVVAAFRRAFPQRGSGATLIVNAANLGRYPDTEARLRFVRWRASGV